MSSSSFTLRLRISLNPALLVVSGSSSNSLNLGAASSEPDSSEYSASGSNDLLILSERVTGFFFILANY
uniref:Putative secreted protein n=1 Tax=Anopheles triannulatus TaxID=58253 RepID=A0A2M4B5B6_9DIPT